MCQATSNAGLTPNPHGHNIQQRSISFAWCLIPSAWYLGPGERLTLIDVFLVVGDQGLGDSLTDSVDLRSVTTAGDANTDVDLRELVETDDQKGLVDL